MAKVQLKAGVSKSQGAAELRTIGVSLKQRLPDGTYVAHVFNKHLFQLFIDHETGKENTDDGAH